jgi:excisionase family DNA binding protein
MAASANQALTRRRHARAWICICIVVAEARDGGVEPTTFGSGGPFAECRPLPVASDALGDTQETACPTVGLVGSFRGNSGADRCKTVHAIGRLRGLPGRVNDLLSVREIAARLGVSTATVYRLCDRGELPHVRISNAIRFAPADLAEFIARTRRPCS